MNHSKDNLKAFSHYPSIGTNLVMQVQRDAAIATQHVIAALRERQIGAHSASHSDGLDQLVQRTIFSAQTRHMELQPVTSTDKTLDHACKSSQLSEGKDTSAQPLKSPEDFPSFAGV